MVAKAEGVKPVCLSPENTVSGSMVEDFFAVVKGGSSESVTALVAKKLPSPELMNLWGDAVSFNPDFIRTTVSPLVFVHTRLLVSLCIRTLHLLQRLLSLFDSQFHSRSLFYTFFPALPSERTFAKAFVTVPPGLADWQGGKVHCINAAVTAYNNNKNRLLIKL